MTGQKQPSYLARRVLSQIMQSYTDKSPSIEATNLSLVEAIDSLKPFTPLSNDIVTINSYLKRKQASDIACKAAWALYKDLVIISQNKRTKDYS